MTTMLGLQSPLAFLSNLGPTELIIILLLVVVFFGGKKLPELARGMGKAINEFKKASREVEQDIKESIESEPAKKSLEEDAAKAESKSHA